MTFETQCEAELRRTMILVRKDHRHRWVYRGPNGISITESPIPFREKISVYWMPIVGAVACNYSPAALAHNSIGAL